MQIRHLALFLLLALPFTFGACESEAPPSGSISAEVFLADPPAGALVLDVRTPEEFAGGHIESAVNIPHDELDARLGELGEETTRPIVVHCESGRRAAKAEAVLADAGYSSILHLEGDMKGWRSEGRPLIRESVP